MKDMLIAFGLILALAPGRDSRGSATRTTYEIVAKLTPFLSLLLSARASAISSRLEPTTRSAVRSVSGFAPFTVINYLGISWQRTIGASCNNVPNLGTSYSSTLRAASSNLVTRPAFDDRGASLSTYTAPAVLSPTIYRSQRGLGAFSTPDDPRLAKSRNLVFADQMPNVKCDGVTDDAAALARGIRSNMQVIFPAAKICVVSGLALSGLSDFILTGGGTLRLTANTNNRVLEIANSTDFTVDHLLIDGNRQDQMNPGTWTRINDGIALLQCKRYKVIDNVIRNTFYGAGILAVDNRRLPGSTADRENNAFVDGNTVMNAGVVTPLSLCDGIFISQDSSTISNNRVIDVTDAGIAGDYAVNLTIENNTIRGNAAQAANHRMVQGIAILGASRWRVHGNSVEWGQLGIIVTLSGHDAVSPYISDNVTIYDNTVTNIDSKIYAADGISADPSAKNILVTGNVTDSTKRGIVVTSARSLIAFNHVANPASSSRGIYAGGAGTRVICNVVDGALGAEGIFVQDANEIIGANHVRNAAAGINFNGVAAEASGNAFGMIAGPHEAGDANVVFIPPSVFDCFADAR